MRPAQSLSCAAALGAAVVASLTAGHARAGWQEEAFEVVAQGAPNTELHPSLATGVDYPTPIVCEEPPCPGLEEYETAVTRVAFVDTGNVGGIAIASRYGEPGESWNQQMVWEGPAQHPKLVLDRDGGEIVTFLDMTSQSDRLRIARRTLPGTGNCGEDDSMYCRRVTGGNITMPAPVVVQYYAAVSGPFDGERRIHVIFSRDGELWHAYIHEERFWAGEPFIEYPIGAGSDFMSGEVSYEPDEVQGEWPAAAPLWTTNNDESPFNYEQMPAVAFDNGDVVFRRAEEPLPGAGDLMYWTDRALLGTLSNQRPTIDTRKLHPVVAWADSCASNDATPLEYIEAKLPEPYSQSGWPSSPTMVAETGCDPTLSVGKYDQPYIAYVDSGQGTIEMTVRLFEDKPWEAADTIDDGAEPSMDYSEFLALQSLAYTEPSSGELRVVDGFWY